MKKRLLPLILVFVILLTLGANAAIAPRGDHLYPQLTFSGSTANCSVTITQPNKQIEATLALWKGNRLIDSWPGSGTSVVYISGSASVTPGETYTLKVYGTADGVPFDLVSVSGTC